MRRQKLGILGIFIAIKRWMEHQLESLIPTTSIQASKDFCLDEVRHEGFVPEVDQDSMTMSCHMIQSHDNYYKVKSSNF